MAAVSIRTAFKEVFSPKYNKLNVLIYLLIVTILSVMCQALSITASDNIGILILCTVLYIILFAYQLGALALTSNNLTRNKSSVFPSVSDFPKIFLVGIKYYIGTLVYGIAIGIFIAVSTFISVHVVNSMANPVLSLAIAIISSVIAIIIIVQYVIPAFIFFIKNLKISSFFAGKQILEFRKKMGNAYGIWLLKNFLTGIIFLLVVLPIYLVSITIIGMNTISGAEAEASTSVQAVMSIIMTFISGSAMTIYSSLNAQLIKTTLPKEPKKRISKISKEQ